MTNKRGGRRKEEESGSVDEYARFVGVLLPSVPAAALAHPAAARQVLQPHTEGVVPAVTAVTEQHLILVRERERRNEGGNE